MLFVFFFFKQKTAYEMRISDWSSDVCSSDLIEVEALGRARLLEHEEREAFCRPVGQPLLGAEAVALRLRDLLGVLVEEEIVVEALGRAGAEAPADLRAALHRVAEIIAGTRVVDAQRIPALPPVGLPFTLPMAPTTRPLAP